MNKKVTGLVVAAVMALLGTLAIFSYVRGAEDRALAGEELASVLVAVQPIPAGTPAEQLGDLAEVEQVPAKITPAGALADLEPVAGQVTAVEIIPGEALNSGRFVAPEDFTARPGSVAIEEGMLEVTVAMSQEQFVGGVPVPGDRVAVIANGPRSQFIPFLSDPLQAGTLPVEATTAAGAETTVSKIIIQHALVTNVQGNPLPAAPAAQTATERVAPADGSVLVTLALNGVDTERLMYVRGSQTLNANLHMAIHHGDEPVNSRGVSVENIIDPEVPGT